ncbi:MAG: hypothetical protein HOQ20_02300 [Bradyrhizobium sp.]|nr:hypothetical protein [Bradyrhizobium sp.]
MSDDKNRIDAPDEKSVGSRDPKGPIPKEPIEGSAGEDDGVGGTGGTVKNQDNPTSVPAG